MLIHDDEKRGGYITQLTVSQKFFWFWQPLWESQPGLPLTNFNAHWCYEGQQEKNNWGTLLTLLAIEYPAIPRATLCHVQVIPRSDLPMLLMLLAPPYLWVLGGGASSYIASTPSSSALCSSVTFTLRPQQWPCVQVRQLVPSCAWRYMCWIHLKDTHWEDTGADLFPNFAEKQKLPAAQPNFRFWLAGRRTQNSGNQPRDQNNRLSHFLSAWLKNLTISGFPRPNLIWCFPLV